MSPAKTMVRSEITADKIIDYARRKGNKRNLYKSALNEILTKLEGQYEISFLFEDIQKIICSEIRLFLIDEILSTHQDHYIDRLIPRLHYIKKHCHTSNDDVFLIGNEICFYVENKDRVIQSLPSEYTIENHDTFVVVIELLKIKKEKSIDLYSRLNQLGRTLHVPLSKKTYAIKIYRCKNIQQYDLGQQGDLIKECVISIDMTIYDVMKDVVYEIDQYDFFFVLTKYASVCISTIYTLPPPPFLCIPKTLSEIRTIEDFLIQAPTSFKNKKLLSDFECKELDHIQITYFDELVDRS